jgi:hypothetical protein
MRPRDYEDLTSLKHIIAMPWAGLCGGWLIQTVTYRGFPLCNRTCRRLECPAIVRALRFQSRAWEKFRSWLCSSIAFCLSNVKNFIQSKKRGSVWFLVGCVGPVRQFSWRCGFYCIIWYRGCYVVDWVRIDRRSKYWCASSWCVF